jgi:hypothetical protein
MKLLLPQFIPPQAGLGSSFSNFIEQRVAVYPELVEGSLTCALPILFNNKFSIPQYCGVRSVHYSAN